jgi:MFS family permease
VDNLPPGQRRDIAFMALPLAFSAATAAAPAVAAFLAQPAGWRWSFVPQIVLAGALLLVVRWVPATPTKARMPIDWPGAMMALAGTAAILGGVTLGDEYGWWQAAKQYLILGTWPWPFSLSVAPVLILTGAGLIGLWLYRRRNRSARSRVSPFRVGTLGRRSFFATVVTGGLHNMAIGGLMFAFFVYVPFAFALRGLATTIAILPFTLATLAASFLIPLFSRRLAPRRLLQAGLVVGCAGALVLITAISPEGSLVGLIPGLLLSGLGAGVVWAQVPRLVHASTADEPNEEATGVSNSMQLLGNSVGTALLGGLFMVIAAALLVHGVAEQLGATLTAERQGELIQQMSDLLRTLRPEEVRQHVSQLPAEIRAAVADTGRAAADGAMRLTLVAIAGTLALALAISAIAPPDERQTD